jgi:hypothetical protein
MSLLAIGRPAFNVPRMRLPILIRWGGIILSGMWAQ